MGFALNARSGARCLAATIVAFAAATAISGDAAAQNYPDKPVRVILGFAPGTPPDLAMRRISDPVGAILGQPVLIESKPGAAGVIGAEFVAKSAPDGYTLMAGTLGTHAFNPNLYKSLPYDALKDFTPITRIISGGFNTFLVNPNLPANNVTEFIALA